MSGENTTSLGDEASIFVYAVYMTHTDTLTLRPQGAVDSVMKKRARYCFLPGSGGTETPSFQSVDASNRSVDALISASKKIHKRVIRILSYMRSVFIRT